MSERWDDLLNKGRSFNSANNCYQNSNGIYGRVPDDYQSWVTCIDDYIIKNYGKKSAPYKLFEKFNTRYIDGKLEGQFDQQYSILIGALKACKGISAKKKILI